MKTVTTGRIWVEQPESGKRSDASFEEHRGFWTWAMVEVLRHSGIRIEELTELSHHSLIQYRLPATGELIPLLQITPSKTDQERLLVISPELADVLSAIIGRIRDNLLDRITEAETNRWFGEAEGLKVSLAGARDKLAQ